MTFFADIRGKFSAGFQGRYLGHILELVASRDPTVLESFLGCFSISRHRAQVTAEAEHRYGADGPTERFADLAIFASAPTGNYEILVEIKVNDRLGLEQLKNYLDWCSAETTIKRRLLVLSAYPLRPEAQELIALNKDVARHIYISKFAGNVRGATSTYAELLLEYLTEEGYCMFNVNDPLPNSHHSGLAALKSYMVLNFLPHVSGFGKVSSQRFIANGPKVFSQIVQNWQLVSEMMGNILSASVIPTVRYFPQQGMGKHLGTFDLRGESLLDDRAKARKDKAWGRYWLTADMVLRGTHTGKDTIRLEWGQILQIEKGKSTTEESRLKCATYALVRQGRKQIAHSGPHWLSAGLRDEKLYSLDKFSARILGHVSKCRDCLEPKHLAGRLLTQRLA